jgi:hypothetical protein
MIIYYSNIIQLHYASSALKLNFLMAISLSSIKTIKTINTIMAQQRINYRYRITVTGQNAKFLFNKKVVDILSGEAKFHTTRQGREYINFYENSKLILQDARLKKEFLVDGQVPTAYAMQAKNISLSSDAILTDFEKVVIEHITDAFTIDNVYIIIQ